MTPVCTRTKGGWRQIELLRPLKAKADQWLGLARTFIDDHRGVSAVEFAFVSPMLFAAYMGISEISVMVSADRKVTGIASATGDLVAQAVQISNAEMGDIFNAAEIMIHPFEVNDLEVRITSVRRQNDKFLVNWSDGYQTADYADDSEVAVPNQNLIEEGSLQTLIMAEVKFTYTSPIGQMFTEGITFEDSFYLRPRRAMSVQRVN